MTRLWVLSDLHLGNRVYENHQRVFDRAPDADVCVVAGDVAEDPIAAAAWLGRHIRPWMPVVWVLGNHEFYGGTIERTPSDARTAAVDNGIVLLDDDAADICNVRFLGTTLWTDYRLFAGEDAELRRKYMASARLGLNDHRQIDLRPGDMGRFRPIHAAQIHASSREWLDRMLGLENADPTVVVTHHGPHPLSVHPRFARNPVTPAFVSDLTDIIEKHQPPIWLHGHTHDAFDYNVGGTRIVCNPRGYSYENGNRFDPHLVIDVPTPAPKPKGR